MKIVVGGSLVFNGLFSLLFESILVVFCSNMLFEGDKTRVPFGQCSGWLAANNGEQICGDGQKRSDIFSLFPPSFNDLNCLGSFNFVSF